MPVIVNGYELSDADMERELPNHQDLPDPIKSAMTALVLRRILLDEVQHLNIDEEDDEKKIDLLLKQEIKVPMPNRAECLRQYHAHPERFTMGEIVEASHILFQVTPGVDLEALRQHANIVLADILENPQLFAECAKANSNCPSSEVGGSLGQIGRGDTVPEFEQVVFNSAAQQVIPRLVESRFGLHIIQLGRKAEGRLLPFDDIEKNIATAMYKASHDHALRQYLQLLVGRAKVSGIDLSGADSLLVQ